LTFDKSLFAAGSTMMILKLLEQEDLYGYQMIEELSRRSDRTFELKTGTLYPLLHGLEEKGLISAYEKNEATQRPRRYYHLTDRGRRLLADKQTEWTAYTEAVRRVLEGGACIVTA